MRLALAAAAVLVAAAFGAAYAAGAFGGDSSPQVGAMPDLNAMGEPHLLPLGRDYA